ncbi:hypothetical protein, partial [Streptococcus gordonii]
MNQIYAKEFKDTIVQFHETVQSFSDLGKEYGDAVQMIDKWI